VDGGTCGIQVNLMKRTVKWMTMRIHHSRIYSLCLNGWMTTWDPGKFNAKNGKMDDDADPLQQKSFTMFE
jgi:hypothetical protein